MWGHLGSNRDILGRTGCWSSRVSIPLHGRMQVPTGCTPNSSSPMGWGHPTQPGWGHPPPLGWAPQPCSGPKGQVSAQRCGGPSCPQPGTGAAHVSSGAPHALCCAAGKAPGWGGQFGYRVDKADPGHRAGGSTCPRALSFLSLVPVRGTCPTLAAPGGSAPIRAVRDPHGALRKLPACCGCQPPVSCLGVSVQPCPALAPVTLAQCHGHPERAVGVLSVEGQGGRNTSPCLSHPWAGLGQQCHASQTTVPCRGDSGTMPGGLHPARGDTRVPEGLVLGHWLTPPRHLTPLGQAGSSCPTGNAHRN